MVLTRTDKQPDRCEVSVEQLAAASTVAENMSRQLGKTVRVCGWYHSHPHITVLPSHVDVRTQMQYQFMDEGFIGLIFAVFQQDGQKVGKIEVTAFQSMKSSSAASQVHTHDAGTSASDSGKQLPVHSEWVGKNIPLAIHPPDGGSAVPIADALNVLCGLQNTLFEEERAAYLSALQQHRGLGATATQDDLLEQVYCSAVYSKSLTSLLGESMLPLLQTLKAHAKNLHAKADALEQSNAALQSRIA
ncbi:hypothetical protein JKP88DRAFT_185812 [Tribonema minus]|uniref:MPN domain-containing protein n=1 Tax=Tribonema minus TaxID=303371 RepID=A0A836CFJ1_9STRA|nr:hypothetical protein JKP88DRAFT_185812 [Tribonema minus]